MPITVAAALATASLSMPVCSWDQPGRNPFVGDVVSAVDRYQDIPPEVRSRLKARMAARRYDEIVAIGRDGIQGRATYAPDIREMHFGAGQTCATVTRTSWSADQRERGLVYCEDEHCILVPTVCRNVSRITRESPAPSVMAARGIGPGAPGAEGLGGGGGAPAAAGAEGAPAVTIASIDPASAAAAGPSFADGAALPVSEGQTAAVLAGAATPAGEAASVGGSDAAPAGGGGTFGPGPSLPWAGGAALPGPVDNLVPSASDNTGSGGDSGTGGGGGTTIVDGGGIDLGPGTGTSSSGGGGTTDPISAVPEPGTWALWLTGLGLVGWLTRRRRLG